MKQIQNDRHKTLHTEAEFSESRQHADEMCAAWAVCGGAVCDFQYNSRSAVLSSAL